MSTREYSIGLGLAKGFEKAMTNVYNIRVAKDKLKRDRELFDLTKKQKTLEIKKMELDPEFDPEFVESKKQHELREIKIEDAKFDLELNDINSEESILKKELENKRLGVEIFGRELRSYEAGKKDGREIKYKEGRAIGFKTSSATKRFDRDFRTSIESAIENPEEAKRIKHELSKKYPTKWKEQYADNFDTVLESAKTLSESEKKSWLADIFSKGVEGITRFFTGARGEAGTTETIETETEEVNVEERFNQLIEEGKTEDEAYTILKEEGYK